jgi:two-component system nitrogen regulation response regulator GlnG
MDQLATIPAMSILVVEDDERAGLMLADLLRGDGFAVELCVDGRAGVERLGLDPLPDVLITDLRMPAVDGATVVRQARRRCSTMPVVVVTAYPQLAPSVGAGPALMMFVKPIDYHALLATLDELRLSIAAEAEAEETLN